MAVLAPYLTEKNSLIDWIDELGDNFRAVELPRQIGFDRVKVSMDIIRVDWDAIEMILNSEAGQPYRSLSVQECRSDEKNFKFVMGSQKIIGIVVLLFILASII